MGKTPFEPETSGLTNVYNGGTCRNLGKTCFCHEAEYFAGLGGGINFT